MDWEPNTAEGAPGGQLPPVLELQGLGEVARAAVGRAGPTSGEGVTGSLNGGDEYKSRADEPDALGSLDEAELRARYLAQLMAAPAPEPRVGGEWQCAVPPRLGPEAARQAVLQAAAARRDQLCWAPPPGMAEQELDSRVQRAMDAICKLQGRSHVALDRVLALLCSCEYDVARAVSEAVAHPDTVRFVVRDGWSSEEQQLFEQGLEHVGKQWRVLQALVATRSLEEVYTRYYATKRARDERSGFGASERALFGNHRLNLLRSLYALRRAPALRPVRLRLQDPLDCFYEQYGGVCDSDEEAAPALDELLADAGPPPTERRGAALV